MLVEEFKKITASVNNINESKNSADKQVNESGDIKIEIHEHLISSKPMDIPKREQPVDNILDINIDAKETDNISDESS
jgi:hypothetical protein